MSKRIRCCGKLKVRGERSASDDSTAPDLQDAGAVQTEQEPSMAGESGPARRTWNYRVIRFDHGDEIEYSVHEVHYLDEHPIGYVARPTALRWFDTDEPGAPERLLKRLSECIAKPALTVAEIRASQEDAMTNWDSMGAVGAERFWEPARARVSFKKRLSLKALIDATRQRKRRGLR